MCFRWVTSTESIVQLTQRVEKETSVHYFVAELRGVAHVQRNNTTSSNGFANIRLETFDNTLGAFKDQIVFHSKFVGPNKRACKVPTIFVKNHVAGANGTIGLFGGVLVGS